MLKLLATYVVNGHTFTLGFDKIFSIGFDLTNHGTQNFIQPRFYIPLILVTVLEVQRSPKKSRNFKICCFVR